MPNSTEAERIDIHLSADTLAAVDQFMLEQDPKLARKPAIEHIIQDWLIGHGYLPFEDNDEHGD